MADLIRYFDSYMKIGVHGLLWWLILNLTSDGHK